MLLIAQLQNTLVISQSKQFSETQYHYNANSFYQNLQQVQQSPLQMLSPLLNPLFSQFYTESKPTDQHVSPIASESSNMHVSSSRENSTFFHNINLSNIETHDKPINSNNSYNGQIDSSEIEYLPTIAAPFIDSLAHGIIGGLQQHVQLIKPGTYLRLGNFSNIMPYLSLLSHRIVSQELNGAVMGTKREVMTTSAFYIKPINVAERTINVLIIF